MLSKRMENLSPYVPGEQPKDRDYIKLNANENPYPPAPEVCAALTDFICKEPSRLARYPDPDSNALKAAIADMLNRTGGVLCRAKTVDGMCRAAPEDALPFAITPDMIYVGNGSDEVLSFLFYAFFDAETPLVFPEHTYSFYPVYSAFYGIKTVHSPLKADWKLDTDALMRNAAENKSPIIIANPNAPTGLALSRDAVRQLLHTTPKNCVFVVDEAYADFGGQSCIPLLAEFPNLVIVRTFSKSFSAAGMRLGYLIASPELVRAITTVKNSVNHFPVDALTQIAGIAACQNAAYYADCAKKIVHERDAFLLFLQSRGWNTTNSVTNFVFAAHPAVQGEEAYRRIKEDGILVRHFNTPGIGNFIRITIGTADQMRCVKAAIEKLPAVQNGALKTNDISAENSV